MERVRRVRSGRTRLRLGSRMEGMEEGMEMVNRRGGVLVMNLHQEGRIMVIEER